jgi:hypothetical protein
MYNDRWRGPAEWRSDRYAPSATLQRIINKVKGVSDKHGEPRRACSTVFRASPRR